MSARILIAVLAACISSHHFTEASTKGGLRPTTDNGGASTSPTSNLDHCGCYKIVRDRKELRPAVSCESDDSHLCCHLKGRAVEKNKKAFCCVSVENEPGVPFVEKCKSDEAGWAVEDLFYKLKNRSPMRRPVINRRDYARLNSTVCAVMAMILPLIIVLLVLLIARRFSGVLNKQRLIKTVGSIIQNGNQRQPENRKYSDNSIGNQVQGKSKDDFSKSILVEMGVERSSAKDDAGTSTTTEATSDLERQDGRSMQSGKLPSFATANQHTLPVKQEAEVRPVQTSRKRSNMETERSVKRRDSLKIRRQSSD